MHYGFRRKMLIWGDYSQMELRILAEFSQDKQMIKAFTEGLDLHTYTASLVFKVPYDKVREQKNLTHSRKELEFWNRIRHRSKEICRKLGNF